MKRLSVNDGLCPGGNLHGQPVELRDTMIAGIVLSRRATLATRNTVHFEDAGISMVNPWAE